METDAQTRPNLFDFDNYQLYLKEWFAWQKFSTKNYSYREFSTATGFKSPNQLLLIIQGKRNITRATLPKICRTLNLGHSEKKYFSELVRFNQASDMPEKKRRLKKISSHFLNRDIFLKKDQYHYLTNWFYTAIRELVTLKDFIEDGEWIAKKLGHRVSPRQALKAIAELLKLNLLARNPQGKLVQTSHYVSTGSEVQNVAAFLYHDQMINIAKESLASLSEKKRNVSALSFTLREKDYEMVVTEINAFRKHMITLLTTRDKLDEDDDLFQLNVHLFPLTRSDV